MIIILIKEPGEDLETREVEDKLKNYQKIVGGYIETVSIAENLILVCNEEGMLQNLPVNIIGNNIFYGTVFFVRTEYENFASLTDADIELITSQLF